MKISEIKELIQLVNESEITEMELEREEVKLLLRKGGAQVQAFQYQPAPTATTPISYVEVASMPVTAPAPTPMATAPALTHAPQAEPQAKGTPVKAPMVGTYYSKPRPEADEFVKKGDRVKTGQTLCIIEAMKLMNQIEAEFSGILVDILVENGQPVEYGQTLFVIDPEK